MQVQVALLATGIAGASLFPISTIDSLPRFWFFFFITGFSLALFHWFSLSGFIDTLFSGKGTIIILTGSFAFFTLALELGLCFVSIKLNRILLLPTAFAIVIIPAAVMLYCLISGITTLIRHGRV